MLGRRTSLSTLFQWAQGEACTLPWTCCRRASTLRWRLHNFPATECTTRRSNDRKLLALESFRKFLRRSTECPTRTIEFYHRHIWESLTVPASWLRMWRTSRRSTRWRTFPSRCTSTRTSCSPLRSFWTQFSHVDACCWCCGSTPSCWWCSRSSGKLSIRQRFSPRGNRRNMEKSTKVRRRRRSKNSKSWMKIWREILEVQILNK